MNAAEFRETVEREALRRAREAYRHPTVRGHGIGGEAYLENQFAAMVVFAMGAFTGQEKMAARILAEADKEKG